MLDLADHAPGAYLWLFTNDLTQTVDNCLCATTEPGAVKRLLSATQKRPRALRRLPVTVGVAGGSVGIAQALTTISAIGCWLARCLGFSELQYWLFHSSGRSDFSLILPCRLSWAP